MHSRVRGRVVVAVALALIALSGARTVAAVPVTDESDDSTWGVEELPGQTLSMKAPEAWVTHDLPSGAEAKGSAAGAHNILNIGNPANGDNVVVNEWTGKQAGWYANRREFQQMAELSASSSNGKVLATGKRKVAGMPAYWEIETYRDPAVGNTSVLYCEFEILTGSQRVLTFAINVDKHTPHARRLVMNLIKNVDAR